MDVADVASKRFSWPHTLADGVFGLVLPNVLTREAPPCIIAGPPPGYMFLPYYCHAQDSRGYSAVLILSRHVVGDSAQPSQIIFVSVV